MIQQTPFVRRQVRKLLLFICGSKEKYRQLRDLHTLDSHMRGIKKLLEEQGIFLRGGIVTATSGSALQYDTLINLVSNRHMWCPTISYSSFRLDLCELFFPFSQMEHLKACAEIATQRTINWQKFCMKDDCKCTIQDDLVVLVFLVVKSLVVLIDFSLSLCSGVVLPTASEFPSGWGCFSGPAAAALLRLMWQ